MNKKIIRAESMLRHLSVGDALGKICSKYTEEEVISIYGKKITELVTPIRRKSTYNWKKGWITDDTILSLLVADSIIFNKRFNREDVARRMMVCDPRGGRQIQKLKNSKNPQYVAEDGYTNGAAIRVLPLAFYSKSLNELTKDTIELSTLTHNTNEALCGAIATVYTQYAVLNNFKKIPNFITEEISKRFPKYIKTKCFSNLILALSFSEKTPDLADLLEEKIGFNMEAWSSIPAGIALGIYSNNNYNQFMKIIHRKNKGGDLDSVASIAGSIMGAKEISEEVFSMSDYISKANNIDFQNYAKKLIEVSK